MIRTKAVLDHEERNVYRVSVKATDAGRPPRHSVRALRVEVLALADNRPTFTSSSLTFNVSIIDLAATAAQLSFTVVRSFFARFIERRIPTMHPAGWKHAFTSDHSVELILTECL